MYGVINNVRVYYILFFLVKIYCLKFEEEAIRLRSENLPISSNSAEVPCALAMTLSSK